MRYASRPRASSSAEERELDKALASRAVSAPFFVKGTQRLREPLKLFLTGPNAKADNGSSAVNNAKCIEFGADGLQEGALQALIQVGARCQVQGSSVRHSQRSYLQYACLPSVPLLVRPTCRLVCDMSVQDCRLAGTGKVPSLLASAGHTYPNAPSLLLHGLACTAWAGQEHTQDAGIGPCL